ncbi:hypothetical protein B0A48_08762 [Cryoendolithus antarcticus]|uniref:Uncharacterized protein n=1 Tax=Cryoendolithus antarcticus TaxID=1507870 RepID=A0A1V8T4F2_9PEZI|nr:hypothetical protein B0A48_08762 [Cryoendolithus antarcticus]
MQSAALWRVAGNCAAKLVRLALAAAGDEGANGEEEKGQEIDLREPQRSQIVGLLTYLLAVGSLTPTLTMGRTPKNTYPQLPKTSPAALALAVVAQDTSGAARRLFRGLSRDAFVSGVVRPLVLTEVRNIGNLVTVGGLRQVTPQPANTTLEVTYDRGTGAKDILAGGEPPLWQSMWKAALSLDATNLTAAYRFGLFSGAPFHVTWSNDVQTAVPPTSGTSVPLLTFESRYGWNVMNIGWSPSTSRFMFAKSYLPLVAALALAQLAAATPAARALGTDRLPLALNLEPELNLIAGWN